MIIAVDVIVNLKTYIDSLTSEAMTAVSTEINSRYDILIRYLKYYHANMIYYTNKYTTVNTGSINYGWSKFLGHYYFTNYEFELGGKQTSRGIQIFDPNSN